MPESPLKGPIPEDLLAVAGHACSARLTRLPDIEDGIDFTPDATVKAAFARLQSGAMPPPDSCARAASTAAEDAQADTDADADADADADNDGNVISSK